VQALDHDFGQEQKLVPFGLLNLTTRALQLTFGEKETSDSWADVLQLWWEQTRSAFTQVKRLVFYLDNGPSVSGSRTQFLKRMVKFCDWSGLEIRLVYYPPYHSKYNPVERCWSVLERKWNGLLLSSVPFVIETARRMTWHGQHPAVAQLPAKHYPDDVTLTKRQMRPWEARLTRSPHLPKYDITIQPNVPMEWCGFGGQ
jgi:hypothetical protein